MKKEKVKNKTIKALNITMMIVDVFCVVLAMFLSLSLRFWGAIKPPYFERLMKVLLLIVLFDISIFNYKSFYRSVLDEINQKELKNYVYGTLLASMINIVVCELTFNSMPRSCYFFFFIIITLFIVISRMVYCYCSKEVVRIEDDEKDKIENSDIAIDVDVSKAIKLKEVEIEDLLEREPIEVNLVEIMDYINNKTILVTGAGGSIGSELSYQIAKNNPKQLIILDIYENNLYQIQLELSKQFPNLNLVALIASVRDEGKIDAIFKQYQPDIVYHAAAHKHVPLMEDSPNEAIKNNVFGTYNVAEACYKYQVKKMVLISSDKAVNPTNIMGASKRICEMLIQAYAHKSTKTEFVAVRFGNVLGSNGSFVNLFKRQILKGGPITVTDPEVIRYLMTIAEAVALVLQAGYYAKGGEIFVFDMGKPVKILDIAKKLISLYGLKPNEDIEIVFTGLRPGEKLYEELLMAEEGLQETPNKLIYIGKPIEMDYPHFFKQLAKLKELAYQETDQMKEVVSQLVSTYKYQK